MGKYVDEAGLTRVVSQTKDLVAASQKVATSSTPGIVKPDGSTLSVQSDGTIGLHQDMDKKFIPNGGLKGGFLVKKSGVDYDTEWVNAPENININELEVSNKTILRGVTTIGEEMGSDEEPAPKQKFRVNNDTYFAKPVSFHNSVKFNWPTTFLSSVDLPSTCVKTENVVNKAITSEKLADAAVTKAKLASDISIPDIEYSQTDLEAGVSELAAGKLYFVYE